jgi:hypothetical protein
MLYVGRCSDTRRGCPGESRELEYLISDVGGEIRFVPRVSDPTRKPEPLRKNEFPDAQNGIVKRLTWIA